MKRILFAVLAVCLFGGLFAAFTNKKEYKSNPVGNPVGIPVTISGTTNASGNFTYTFPNPYPVAPNIQASITNQGSTNQFIRVSNVSTTGFTVNVFQRSAVTLLSVEVLLAATTNVSGASVDVLVTQK